MQPDKGDLPFFKAHGFFADLHRNRAVVISAIRTARANGAGVFYSFLYFFSSSVLM